MKQVSNLLWNKMIRGIHWSIFAIVVLNLFILEEGEWPHRYLGYAACAFVAGRFFYGLGSTGPQAFREFPLSLFALKSFLISKMQKKAVDYPGHNPAASWVYISIWACLLGLGVTGWLMGLDRFFGEDLPKEIHEAFSTVLEVLIVFHLIGIFLDAIQFRRRTWMGMITGRRES